MPWDDSPSGGFTTGHPWLPLHPSFRERNVAAQRQDPGSVLSFYRSLLRLRRGSLALRRGSFHPLQQRPRSGLVYLRQADTERAVVALNFTPRPQKIRLDVDPGAAKWRLALSSLSHPAARLTGREVTLGPHEAAVFTVEL
jgi:glycosidase